MEESLTAIDLETRRSDTLSRLEALHAARGAAVLDNRKPPHAEIASAQAELADIDAAESEAARRQRAEEARALEKRLAKARKQIDADFADYMDDWQSFDRDMRSMVGAIDRILTRASSMRSVAKEMRVRVPPALAPRDLERRLSEWLIVHLRGRSIGLGNFGDLDLRSSPTGVTAAAEIAATERRRVLPEIGNLKESLR